MLRDVSWALACTHPEWYVRVRAIQADPQWRPRWERPVKQSTTKFDR